MSKNNICPECGNSLTLSRNHCACGWFAKDRQVQRIADHGCAYSLGQSRCPLPGGICPFPYSKEPWYCSGHWRALGDPNMGETVLRNAEINSHKIIASLKDWKRC